jgi:hypothetical protein
MTTNPSFDLDLARLSLIGKRYVEAEGKYLSILKNHSNNSDAWCGLAISKFGLLLDFNATSDEAFYCFEKARILNPDEKKEIEILALEASFEIVKALYEKYIKAQMHSEESKQAMALSMLGGVVSVFSSSLSSERTSGSNNLASLAGTVLSYGGYVNAKMELTLSEADQLRLKDTIQAVIAHIKKFSQDQTLQIESFNNSVATFENAMVTHAPISLPSIDAKQKLLNEQQALIRKSKNWRFFGFIFLLFTILTVVTLLEGSTSANESLTSFFVFGFITFVIFGKASSLKKEASEKDIELTYLQDISAERNDS